MALILNIDTSTNVCSVCISQNGKAIAIREDAEGTNHAAMLVVYIEQLIEELKIELSSLNAIAVSSGPGSYTGLRIGTVTAKGLCYTLNKPLIAVDSLEILKEGMKAQYIDEHFLYCPTIDARRDEIYFALFEKEKMLLKSQNILLKHELPFQISSNKKLIVAGSGAVKCRNSWGSNSIIYETQLQSSSTLMSELSMKKYSLSDFENVSSFEPVYVKPVHITVSKKELKG